MLQRLTESARLAVTYAQEEAALYGDSSVATEHVLLGLLREPECGATRLLGLLGISPEQVREMLLNQGQGGDSGAQRVIELAYQETRQLGSAIIDTEHLLLALIRERHGRAGRALAELGLELEGVRAAVLTPPTSPLPARGAAATGERGLSEGAQAALDAAQREAVHAGRGEVAPEHVLLGLLGEPDSSVVRLLATCKISPEQVRDVLDLPFIPTATMPNETLPLSSSTKSLIALAQEEARLLDTATTDIEHLLLGLLRDSHSVVAKVLSWLGIEYSTIRSAIAPLASSPEPAPDPRITKQLLSIGQQVLRLAPELAQASATDFRAALLGTSAPERIT